MGFHVEYRNGAFRPGNPMHQDHVSMGTDLGQNVMALHNRFRTEKWDVFKLVNMETGEMLVIHLDEFKGGFKTYVNVR